jgi:hypothetical protein
MLACLPPTAYAQVATTVVVEAPSFVSNLGPGLEEAQRATSAALVASLSGRFPVTAWRAWDGAGTPPTSLTIALVEKPGRADTEVMLVWRGTVDGAALNLSELPALPLYTTFQSNRANHDPRQLTLKLTDELARWFDNQDNRRMFQRAFLRNVPIARKATADPSRKRVVLPFTAAALRMDPASQVRVRIASPSRSGFIDLGSVLDDPLARFAVGTVTKLNATDGSDAQGWDPKVPLLLAPANKITVFVEEYVFSAAQTDNGTFDRP